MHIAVVVFSVATQLIASEPECIAARVKDRNRECLVGFMDGCITAIYKHGR